MKLSQMYVKNMRTKPSKIQASIVLPPVEYKRGGKSMEHVEMQTFSSKLSCHNARRNSHVGLHATVHMKCFIFMKYSFQVKLHTALFFQHCS